METAAIEPKALGSKLSQSDVRHWLTKGAIISCESGQILIAWGESQWHPFPTEDFSNGFYFPDFFLLDENPWLNFEKCAYLSGGELISLLENFALDEPSSIQWEAPSKDVFEKGFNELQDLFHSQGLEKAVLYAFSKSSQSLSSAHLKRAILSILQYAQEAPVFVYGFWEESQGTLGATPELLFKLQGGAPAILQTMALAGTQKSNSFVNKMLHDEKLLHEHEIVVEDIVSKLSLRGKVHTGQLQVLSLPVLSHLYTPITMQLEKVEDYSTYVSTLHPTPSLGGRPWGIASKWLMDYNRILPRGRFGAPVGYWNPCSKETVCYVAIRNIMWASKGLFIGAGCGVVAESNFENEWDELLLKTISIIKFLNLGSSLN